MARATIQSKDADVDSEFGFFWEDGLGSALLESTLESSLELRVVLLLLLLLLLLVLLGLLVLLVLLVLLGLLGLLGLLVLGPLST